MKIALFHTVLPEPGRKLGGVEVAVHRLANALAVLPEVREVTVFTLSAKPDNALYKHVRLFGGSRWLIENRIGRAFVLPFLLNFVDFGRPDVLHLHGDDWFYWRRTVPTVRTMHGSAKQEAKTATSLKRKLLTWLVYPLEHLSARLATSTLAVGLEAAEIYKTDAIADNGVDPEVFHPGKKSESPLLLFVGTWEGRKRGSFMYNLFTKRILPAVPKAQMCFVSDQCPEHPQVISEHFPPDAILAERFRQAWIFAYPSTYEGFGIPYLEAMASGTAVVCSPNSGALYVLEGGRYGAIVDDDAFADRLLELLHNQELRSRAERMGLERATLLTWAAVAQRHVEVFTKTLNQSRRDAVTTRRLQRTHERNYGIVGDNVSDGS